MRIIATIEEPTDGDVLLNGVSVREEPELARRVGGLRSGHACRRTRTSPCTSIWIFTRAPTDCAAANATEAVGAIEEFTNVAGIRDKHLKALSKGMKQRVSLGRALVYDPDVLILDEPAAGLDPRARVELRELLTLLAERKKAILISSHILTELTEICNGVVIIERGKILETGTIEDVLKKSAPRRTVAIRLLDRATKSAAAEGTAADAVRGKRPPVRRRKFCLNLAGDESAACEILALLIGKQFKITEFRQTKANLEDIFMTVTKGGVQ